MFLNMNWAMVGDVDINSESMRWIGSSRFFLYGIYRVVINTKLYGA